MAQAKAAKESADRAYEKEKERHDRYTGQLDKCKIYAPQDGMVAYATEAGPLETAAAAIDEGAFVRERQEILSIPNLSRMQVNTAVHESVLDQVKPGLTAVIRVDAFADRTYKGTVKTVAVLPDQGGWLASDTKVYKTIVTIDEEVTQLKPGMTAVVEIDIEQLTDVLSVPIQAIVQRADKNWCYVRVNNQLEKREIALGKTNDKFVEIKQGVQDGDVVVLNPMSLVDEQNAAASEKTAGKEEAQDGENRGRGGRCGGQERRGTPRRQPTERLPSPSADAPRGRRRRAAGSQASVGRCSPNVSGPRNQGGSRSDQKKPTS